MRSRATPLYGRVKKKIGQQWSRRYTQYGDYTLRRDSTAKKYVWWRRLHRGSNEIALLCVRACTKPWTQVLYESRFFLGHAVRNICGVFSDSSQVFPLVFVAFSPCQHMWSDFHFNAMSSRHHRLLRWPLKRVRVQVRPGLRLRSMTSLANFHASPQEEKKGLALLASDLWISEEALPGREQRGCVRPWLDGVRSSRHRSVVHGVQA